MNSSYKEAIGFLESFINYEKLSKFPYKKSLKLTRVENLFKTLKIDAGALKVIHIAGTKGKGSTAVFLSFILAACGFKVGLYTSPHLNDFRERIKILTKSSLAKGKKDCKVRSALISKKEVVDLVREIQPILNKEILHKKLGQISFFEVYTALAFRYFLRQKVDFAVLECGLGGRLDATNVSKPLISIITHIGYDHTRQLGKTLKEITHEKAGIIKKNVPVISSWQNSNSLEVLRSKTVSFGSRLYVHRQDFQSQNLRLRPKHTIFDFTSFLGEYKGLKIKLLGEHQVENSSLAVLSSQILEAKYKYKLKSECMYNGLKQAFLEARFQIINNNKKTFLLDIAHNPSSIKALNAAINRYFFSKKIILVFGCCKDKDVKNMLNNMDFNNIILTLQYVTL